MGAFFTAHSYAQAPVWPHLKLSFQSPSSFQSTRMLRKQVRVGPQLVAVKVTIALAQHAKVIGLAMPASLLP